MRANKSLGQNFLVDPNFQRKIVDALAVGTEDEVLEIGSGRGALTRHLVGRVRRLVLVELDDRLVADLRERWGARPDVHIVHADALSLDLGSLATSLEKLKVVGNIPYNITSPLLFRLLERPRPAEILIMVQREVADRILADPGTAAYGALAVGVRSVADVEKVLQVPRRAFRQHAGRGGAHGRRGPRPQMTRESGRGACLETPRRSRPSARARFPARRPHRGGAIALPSQLRRSCTSLARCG